MANVNPTKLVTDKVRLSFVHVFKPYVNPRNQNGAAKYSVTILLPKSDFATKQRLDAAMNAAIQLGVSSKWNGQQPPKLDICIHDGDGVKPSDGMPFGPECRGHWVFTASSDQAPQVVDLGLNPIINQSDVYSGCYARVSVNFFPYTNSGKKGIGCGLLNVQKLEDGEALGNRSNAAEDFGGGGFSYAGAPGGAFPGQGGYNSPSPTYQQPPYANQPVQAPYNAGQFVAPVQPVQPMQPAAGPYGQPAQAIDPITGRPIGQGGIYGI